MASASQKLKSAPAIMALILLSLAAGRDAWAECPSSPAAASETAERAAAAFAAMNGQEFDASIATLVTQVGCLSGPTSPHDAAVIHQALALAAFKAKDAQGTLTALQAMHASEATFSLAHELSPPGGPLDRRDREAQALAPASRVPHGAGSSVYVDGSLASDLPANRPSLVVVLDARGAVLWSGLVPPGGSIPPLWGGSPPALDIAAADGPPAPTDFILPTSAPTQDESPSRSRAGRPLLLIAGGSAVLAGSLGAWTVSLHNRQEAAASLIAHGATEAEWEAELGEHPSNNEILALNDRGQVAGIGSLVAGGLALGLGTVGLVLTW